MADYREHELTSKMYSVFLFLFLQAEDGIRDIGVTGVQTCALPILGLGHRLRAPARRVVRKLSAAADRVGPGLNAPALRIGAHLGALTQRVARGAAALLEGFGTAADRGIGCCCCCCTRILWLVDVGHLGSPVDRCAPKQKMLQGKCCGARSGRYSGIRSGSRRLA